MEIDKLIAIAIRPVAVVEEHKLYRVRLYIHRKVAQMGEGVNGSQEEDDGADHLVQVDVVVQREYLRESKTCQCRDRFPQNQNEHKHRVEKKRLSVGPGWKGCVRKVIRAA